MRDKLIPAVVPAQSSAAQCTQLGVEHLDAATSRNPDPTDLWDAIDTLPATQREAVMLHYVAGYSYAEIASSLDVTPTAVRGRLHRARLNLRKEYVEMATGLQLELDEKLIQFLRHRADEQDVSLSVFVARLLTKYQRGQEPEHRPLPKLEEQNRIPVAGDLDAEPARAAVRAFFEACLADDFARAHVVAPYDWVEWQETEYGRIVEIIEVGEPYQMPGRSYAGGKGVFVPYAIKLADGNTRRFRCAVRCDNDEAQWRIDGGL